MHDLTERIGTAVLLISHNLGVVREFSDRVYVIYRGNMAEHGTTAQLFHEPRHPYTRALLRCLPTVDRERRPLVEIGGQPPDLARLPAGCPFAPRCPEREAVCEREYPPAVAIGDGHVAHCWAAARVGAPA